MQQACQAGVHVPRPRGGIQSALGLSPEVSGREPTTLQGKGGPPPKTHLANELTRDVLPSAFRVHRPTQRRTRAASGAFWEALL